MESAFFIVVGLALALMAGLVGFGVGYATALARATKDMEAISDRLTEFKEADPHSNVFVGNEQERLVDAAAYTVTRHVITVDVIIMTLDAIGQCADIGLSARDILMDRLVASSLSERGAAK